MLSWNCDNNGKQKCTTLAERDVFYLTILFVFVIIFLMTITMGCSDESNKLFSFASTLTSIVLSLVAIIMTIYSEYKNERAASSLSLAINTIESASDNLRNQTDRQIQELRDLNEQLKNEFYKINNKLDEMNNKIGYFIVDNVDKNHWISNNGDQND